MTTFLKKYKAISLGYNCFCKMYINKYVKSSAYHIFDFTGTSMWSIVELLKNNFDGLLLEDNIKKIKISANRGPIYTNIKYYVRFMHDDFSAGKIKNAINTNMRRINRFNEIINNDDFVIFIRLCESQHERIVYEQYSDKNKKSEYEYVIEFSNWLKNNKKIKFRIIFISENPTKYDNENNLIYIKGDMNKYNVLSEKDVNCLLNINKEFIESCIPQEFIIIEDSEIDLNK